MDNKQARYLHRMLDRLAEGKTLSPQDVETLRKNLPELPIQKTLEEIAWDMHFAWCETFGNDWKEELFGDLETWLSELHAQLRAHLEGVKSEAHPALPAGMRLADHEVYGRVVTSPKPNRDGVYDLLVPEPRFETGTDWDYAHECDLTFIDAEPAAPAHPEFLETEADYQNAPEGTVVAYQGQYPWARLDDGMWTTAVMSDMDEPVTSLWMGEVSRRVLRWGWGE